MDQTEKIKTRKVAVYARVSTEHEAQLSALENQKDWYKPFLAQHPEWQIVGMYVDEGITGTSANKRPQFQKMIKDAEAGNFDLILTREVSRFARNTVDTLQYTRQLKAKGVEVFFINDNIKTFDGDGELRLTIMATLAQDESRKTSIRVKAGQQTSMENGVFYGNGNILGYDRVGKDMVINPEQAETVRMIFEMYLNGMGMKKIQYTLEQEGRLTASGKPNWHGSNISRILRNSFYCGIITYHKEFTPDYLEQKKIKNFGDMEFTKVKGRHEPIVTVEEFERVQKILGSHRKEIDNLQYGRRIQTGARGTVSVWSELMECECGHKFCRRAWHKDHPDEMMRYAYQCNDQTRTGTVKTRLNKGLPIENTCKTPMIPEWKLQMMAKYIFIHFIDDISHHMSFVKAVIAKHINDDEELEDNSAIIEQKQAQIVKLSKRLNGLIDMRADGEITKDVFKEKSATLNEEIDKLQNEIIELTPQPKTEEDEDPLYEDKLAILTNYLDQLVDFENVDRISDRVIRAFVRKIVVHENRIDWYLRFNDPNSYTSVNVKGRKDNAVVVETDESTPTLGNSPTGCNQRKQVIHDYLKIGDFTLFQGDAEMYFKAKSEKREFHNWRDISVNVYV